MIMSMFPHRQVWENMCIWNEYGTIVYISFEQSRTVPWVSWDVVKDFQEPEHFL